MTHTFQFDPNVILGVASGASLREIRDAYHQKSLKYHPDKGGDEWAFRLVARAYEILTTARVVNRAGLGTPPPAPRPEPPPSRTAWDSRFQAGSGSGQQDTLVIADTSSSELKPDGLGRRPVNVEATRQEASGAHWLEMSHDGYVKPFGAVHRRRIYMADTGDDIRGEDQVEAPEPQAFSVRFHLHPAVTASLQGEGEGVLLRLPGGGSWQLRADSAPLSLEESVYLGWDEVRPTEQVVLSVAADQSQLLRWALARVS